MHKFFLAIALCFCPVLCSAQITDSVDLEPITGPARLAPFINSNFLVGDAVKVGKGFWAGTDNTEAIEAQLYNMAVQPWGKGHGGNLVLPGGNVGISRPIRLPRTLWGSPSGAVRLRGQGSNTTMLVPLVGFEGDCLITWEPFHIPVYGFERAKDSLTWVKFAPEDLKLWKSVWGPPSGNSRYNIMIFDSGPYVQNVDVLKADGYKVLERDLKNNRVKIDVAYRKVSADERETFDGLAIDAYGLTLAMDQEIKGLSLWCPWIDGAVGIRHDMLVDDQWHDATFKTWNQTLALRQRLQCDLYDLKGAMRATYHPAFVRIEGSWLFSNVDGVKLTGNFGDYRYDTYVFDVDWRMPSGRDVEQTVQNDTTGAQWSNFKNVHGGNYSAFRGRMNGVTWHGGFFAGGGTVTGREEFTGLPVWDIRHSQKSTISTPSHEGISEGPAEMYIWRSNLVDVVNYGGGGANAFKHAPDDKDFGDMIRMEECVGCRVLRNYGSSHHFGFNRRISPKLSDSPGSTALLNLLNCKHCTATDFHIFVMPVKAGHEYRDSVDAMVDLMIRIDDSSKANGCTAEGVVSRIEKGLIVKEKYSR